MSIPEVEVRSFKQQGGESFKDAWYRISDALIIGALRNTPLLSYLGTFMFLYLAGIGMFLILFRGVIS